MEKSMKNKRVWLSMVLSLAALSVIATTVVARASSPGATIKLGPDAHLANPPSSVIVSVTYSCQPSAFFSYGNVSVDQVQTFGGASGSRIDVFGSGYFQPTCDDRSHRTDVIVSTFFYGGSFTPGTAGASAFVASGVTYANTQIELTIK
jgi:hypothetical protein